MILAIFIHELGHMIFGLLSCYSFLHIEILGLSLEKTGGRLRVRYYKAAPLGQCMMYSEDIERNPCFLIVGGVVANIVTGSGMILLFLLLPKSFPGIILLILGSINLGLGICNLFWGSDHSDGKALREVISSRQNRIYYNRLMLTGKYLREGLSYSDMPEKLFEPFGKNTGKDRFSSLKKDMEIHILRYRLENGAKVQSLKCAGEPFATLIREGINKLDDTETDRQKIFENIIKKAEFEMYPGEYLFAAKCFMRISRERDKNNRRFIDNGFNG